MSYPIFKNGDRVGYYYCTNIDDNKNLLYKVIIDYVSLNKLYSKTELEEYCKEHNMSLQENYKGLF